MENFENNPNSMEFDDQQTQPAAPEQTPPVGEPYSGAGVGRKESPFADSPYVMNHQPNPNQYRCGSTYVPPIPPQPPVKPKKQRSGEGWKRVGSVVLALAVVAGSCGITAALVNERWKKRTDEILVRVDAQTAQMDDLRQQIAAAANGHSVSGTPANTEGLTPAQVYARNATVRIYSPSVHRCNSKHHQ